MQKDKNRIKFKKQNLEENDLLWIKSPISNDYVTFPLDSEYLGEQKLRAVLIDEVIISPDNEKYFLVTHSTSNRAKTRAWFYADKGKSWTGGKFGLNPTETYFYKEDKLASLQEEYIGNADMSKNQKNRENRDYLAERIDTNIRPEQVTRIKRIRSSIKIGDLKRADRLIKRSFLEQTREDAWVQTVHKNASQFNTVDERDEYINANLHKYPWLDDEPSE